MILIILCNRVASRLVRKCTLNRKPLPDAEVVTFATVAVLPSGVAQNATEVSIQCGRVEKILTVESKKLNTRSKPIILHERAYYPDMTTFDQAVVNTCGLCSLALLDTIQIVHHLESSKDT